MFKRLKVIDILIFVLAGLCIVTSFNPFAPVGIVIGLGILGIWYVKFSKRTGKVASKTKTAKATYKSRKFKSPEIPQNNVEVPINYVLNNQDEFNEPDEEVVERPKKGRSIINFYSDYSVIDVETTGLSPANDAIIEFSAVRVIDHQIVDRFSELVNPGVHISSRITKITGITDEMVSTARTIEEVLPEFLNFLGKDIVIGHNVNFDIDFISHSSVRVLGEPFTNDFIDTLRICRKHLTSLSSHKLSDVLEHYDISQTVAHRALADATCTCMLYQRLCCDIEDKKSFIKWR